MMRGKRNTTKRWEHAWRSKESSSWDKDIRAIILRYAELIRRALRDRKTRRVVMGIAGCVTFVTTYALILPAITLEDNVAQQMPGFSLGHRTTAKVLSCEYEIHQHDDSCYAVVDGERKLICGQADYVIHHHDQNCYDEAGNLVCDLTEVSRSDVPVMQHTHVLSCYEYGENGMNALQMGWVTMNPDGTLSGGQEHLTCQEVEVKEHQHTAECFHEVEVEDAADAVLMEDETAQETEQDNLKVDEEQKEVEIIEENNGAPVDDSVIDAAQDVEKGDSSEEAVSEEVVTEPLEEPSDSGNTTIETGIVPATLDPIQAFRDKIESELEAVAEKDMEPFDDEAVGEKAAVDEVVDVTKDADVDKNDSDEMKQVSTPVDDENKADVTDDNSVDNKQEVKYSKTTDNEEDNDVKDAESENLDVDESKDNEVEKQTDTATEEKESNEQAKDYTATTETPAVNGDIDIAEGAEAPAEINNEVTDPTVENADGMVEEPAVEPAQDPVDLFWESKEVWIHVVADQIAAIPADAELKVTEITQYNPAYLVYNTLAKEKLESDETSVICNRFFDIGFIVDGAEVEPEGNVRVDINFKYAQDVEDEQSLNVVHFKENKDVEVLESEASVNKNGVSGISFESDSFSVYGVVYTVDFHWEVNGKMYDFSMPGGGFVSFYNLVEVLGIVDDTYQGENEAENAEITDAESAEGEQTEDPLTLNDVEVSDATRKFVADVEKVEFSDPELVWVGKTDENTTVGELKGANELEVQYSAELTEEQIAEINAQTVEVGDWALISVHPFESEESLTVTMKTGEVFEIKVTDAQRIYKSVADVVTGDYLIYSTSSETINGVKYTIYRYLKNDGTTVIKKSSGAEYISADELADYTWHFTKINDGIFTIKSTKSNIYLTLPGNNSSTNLTSSSSANMKLIQVTNSEGYDSNIKIYNNNETKWINWSGNKGFIVSTSGSASLNLFKIETSSSGGGAQGIVLTDEEKDELDTWKETLERFDTLTHKDKTAEVSDYDNRIYKIDISADSGITDFYKDVDLGFVLDVSNSMNFPSSLSGLGSAWMSASDLDAAKSQYSQYYNIDNCFYIISDPALTSTIYKVFKDGSQWKWQDASVTDGTGIYNLNDGTTFKEPYRQQYTLYYADDQNTRFYYLKNSVNSAIATLNKIVTPTDGVDDETASVCIAYNLFAKEIKQSADFTDLRTRLNDFVLNWSSTDSGTRQNVALYDTTGNATGLSANEFTWDTANGTDKYVILVTDGAPNGPTIDDVKTAAQNLKAAYPGLKIITVGLSTQDVDGGSQMLSEIADSIDGVKQFYEAETANDLEYIMLKILRTIMAKGLVRGKITDTVDEAFYPVNAEGDPITEGVYNTSGKIDGAQIGTYTSEDPYYTWEVIDGKWKITWYNQEVGWDDNDTTTGQKWNGTFHVKAKEDYLGGNLIETNDNASFQATGIKLVINGTPESNWRPLPDSMPQLPYSVPRVNVHNLETDENSTEWTVYKGTSVTPKEQLEALWNAIPIEEVVSSTVNSAHKITTGSGANVGSQGTGETFTLASLISEVAPSFDINSLINQITVSKSSASQEFTYAAYGHESGKITVTVERTVGNQMPATHTADTVGAPVEQYMVTFTYTPYTEDERMNGKVKDPTDTDHHNGTNGRGAEETDTITSINTHTINVYAKKLTINKVDQSNNGITSSPATFKLYRKAVDGDTNFVPQMEIQGVLPSGNYCCPAN